MRFPFSIALSASFITALLAEWPDENLFDVSDSLAEIPSYYPTDDSLAETPSSYPTDDSLQDLFQPPSITTDPPEDGSALALGCTSSGSDELMRKSKIRRAEGICPSPIFSGGTEEFNLGRLLRGRLQEIQDRAQREKRVLPFCPPPTMPLCCVGEVEYLGSQVHDCLFCMSIPREIRFFLAFST